MDAYAQSWYQLKFQNMFLRLKGTAFQDFFADLMSRRHRSDFIRTRPWGPSGDRKNDGYLQSKRKLFQVYAPNEMAANETVSKITEDFAGALPYWEAYFDTWVFVHNALDGLGPEVLRCLLRLKQENPHVDVEQMGYEALEQEVLSLSQYDLEVLLGHAPDARAINSLRSSDLMAVLDQLARADVLPEVEIRPVSLEKIDKNSFSEESKQYLRMGRRKSILIRSIFDSFPDPLTGERIVQTFRARYIHLKLQRLPSDKILSELVLFTGGYSDHYKGGAVEAQRHEAAVAAVLSYLFEQCDIFEDPENWP